MPGIVNTYVQLRYIAIYMIECKISFQFIIESSRRERRNTSLATQSSTCCQIRRCVQTSSATRKEPANCFPPDRCTPRLLGIRVDGCDVPAEQSDRALSCPLPSTRVRRRLNLGLRWCGGVRNGRIDTHRRRRHLRHDRRYGVAGCRTNALAMKQL